MINVTRFNDSQFVINSDLIQTMEETPDTVITLTDGKKLIVEESMDDVVRKTMAYRRALRQY